MRVFLGLGEAPGYWYGRGLEPLALKHGSVVEERELEAMFGRALHPVAHVQLGRAWRADGVTGYDLTFSAPSRPPRKLPPGTLGHDRDLAVDDPQRCLVIDCVSGQIDPCGPPLRIGHRVLGQVRVI